MCHLISICVLLSRAHVQIKEILETGSLRRAVELQNDTQKTTLQQLNKIWGVGPATAMKLYRQGCRSLEDVRARAAELLSPPQQLGLQFHEVTLCVVVCSCCFVHSCG